MTLTLKLRFRTAFGQSLSVTGNHPQLGDGDVSRAVALEYLDPEFWQVVVSFTGEAPTEPIRYNYILRQADGSSEMDWGRDHALSPEVFAHEQVLVVDSWNSAATLENVFFTEPFQSVLLRERVTKVAARKESHPSHTFKVKAPLLARGQVLAILGGAPALGVWNTEKPLLLSRDGHHWSIEVDLREATFPVEYKYGVFDAERGVFVAYEEGVNRRLDLSKADRVVVDDGFAGLAANDWRGAGVAIPVFSLRTANSCGIGEFSDLKPLADWCAQVGLKLIQILPVNDTTSTHTWTDSYPYSAISAFALNPVYLNLDALVPAKNKSLLKQIADERARLNALPEIDYEAVTRTKLGFLKSIFSSQRTATFRSQEYKTFFAENQHWLTPYAVFCCLRDKFGTADSRSWSAHTRCSAETLAKLTAANSPDLAEVEFNYFVQFHLHQQLQQAAAHAHARGIILKGDIAIGVSRNGADTWQSPELYDLSVQAGAPPDPFADKGQNWGFPTYNWPRMQQDGFAWWKQRFAQMSHYFDAFRIDHILGFFRIWSIPTDAVEGILGYFVPAIPVEASEFAARGIGFTRARFVEPFINDQVLDAVFGTGADFVLLKFLQPGATVQYALRPEFATQRKVEQYFATLPDTAENKALKLGLFDLISNVLLIEAPGSGGREFHFRFHIEKTASFRALPAEVRGRLMDLYVDYFFRRQDEFWRKQALQKLPALKRVTNMLICGEDLGLVPACVPDVMRDLGLLSLEIQRMPKTPERAFSRPAEAPYLSVVTPSTHDMSTIRGWWEEEAPLTQRFYNDELGLAGTAPATCSGALNEAVVRQHLASPAMWSIFQLQDLLGMDEALRRADVNAERINIPANPKHYWRYRMHMTVEQLAQKPAFNARLTAMLRQSGR
jgi:4-alpha-glucanotransferase